LKLVKKKLKSGLQRRHLDAVIAGNDGPVSEKAVQPCQAAKLGSLERHRQTTTTTSTSISSLLIIKCATKTRGRHCGAKLMKCKRCKATYYCSKDCQVAGWKLHKELCNQFSSGKLSRSEGISDYHGWVFHQVKLLFYRKRSLQENTGIWRPQEGAIGRD
jgi:hypothetical protein